MDRIKSSRVLRFICVLFLVPLVIFSNPGIASAATSGNMRFAFESVQYAGNQVIGTSCQMPWAAQTTGVVISANSRCDGGPDFTPGLCQSYEGGCGSWGLVLKDLAGSTCASTGLESFKHPDSSLTSTKVGLGGANLSFASMGDCMPVEACLSYFWDGAGPGARDQVACAQMPLEKPDAPESACSYGTPATIRSEWVVDSNEFYYTDWHLVTYVNGVKIGSAGAPNMGEGTEGWNYTVFYMDPERNYTPADLLNIEAPTTYWPDPNLHAGGHYGVFRVPKDPGRADPAPAPENRLSVLGVEVAYGGSPPRVMYGYNRSNDGKLLDAGSIARRAPTAGDHAYGGTTDPALCRFWFGQKVTNIEGSNIDDPFGEVPPPGTEEPPTETPEPEEPPGWDWLYWIYRALQGIASTLLGLAGDIVSGIVNAFESLFVPEDGFFEDQVDRLKDSADGTTIGNYVDALGAMAPSGSSGCEGPSITFPASVFGRSTGTFHPLSACGGWGADIAGWSRIVIGVSVGLSAGFAVIRILGRSFGWDPGLGGPA